MTKQTRTLSRVAAVLTASLLALSLVACSSSDEEGTKATDSTTTSALEEANSPSVTDAWARTATAGGNGAIYMVISGQGEADELHKASVPADIAKTVEIHETVAADGTGDAGHDMTTSSMAGHDTSDTSMSGHDATTTTAMGGGHGTMDQGGKMMTMRPVDKIDIPADGEAVLEPGGYHIMLMDVQKDLVVGDSIPVTLTFKNAGEVQVTAEVKEK